MGKHDWRMVMESYRHKDIAPATMTERNQLIQRDTAVAWHDYGGHLHAHLQDRRVDCFCVRRLQGTRAT